jgi:hypothetical protein
LASHEKECKLGPVLFEAKWSKNFHGKKISTSFSVGNGYEFLPKGKNARKK